MYMEWSMPELTKQHIPDQMRLKLLGMALYAELWARSKARIVFGSLLCILAASGQLPKTRHEDIDLTTISYGQIRKIAKGFLFLQVFSEFEFGILRPRHFPAHCPFFLLTTISFPSAKQSLPTFTMFQLSCFLSFDECEWHVLQ